MDDGPQWTLKANVTGMPFGNTLLAP
jgi:hypothetical protein